MLAACNLLNDAQSDYKCIQACFTYCTWSCPCHTHAFLNNNNTTNNNNTNNHNNLNFRQSVRDLTPRTCKSRRINPQQINYVDCLEVLICLHRYIFYIYIYIPFKFHNPRSVRVQPRRALKFAVREKILNISRTFYALIDICSNTHKSRHGSIEMNSK